MEQERQEAVARAMRRYDAERVREQRRTGLGHGVRHVTREWALNKIAKTHPRAALKILNSYGLGGRRAIPEKRSA